MRRDILSGDHGGAGGHADDVLVMRAGIVDAVCGQGVDNGRPRHLLPVHTDGVETHLICRDEKDFAAHASLLMREEAPAPH